MAQTSAGDFLALLVEPVGADSPCRPISRPTGCRDQRTAEPRPPSHPTRGAVLDVVVPAGRNPGSTVHGAHQGTGHDADGGGREYATCCWSAPRRGLGAGAGPRRQRARCRPRPGPCRSAPQRHAGVFLQRGDFLTYWRLLVQKVLLPRLGTRPRASVGIPSCKLVPLNLN